VTTATLSVADLCTMEITRILWAPRDTVKQRTPETTYKPLFPPPFHVIARQMD